jgi:hypothetical protein
MSDAESQPEGTPFPDSVKIEARRLAFFRCCYCHDRPGDQVHHLIPREEGGQGVLENAILLCVQCHTDYGHRKDKRRQLREARDHWHEIVAKRYAPAALIQAERLDDLATKNDVQTLIVEFRALSEWVTTSFLAGMTTAPQVANVASTMVNTISPQSGFTGFAPGTWAKGVLATLCSECKTALPPNAMFCPACGSRVSG